MVWMAVAVELLVTAIYYALRATSPWRYECLWTSLHARTSGDPPPWATECSPFILLGATLIAFGAVLRLWYVRATHYRPFHSFIHGCRCFRTLGPLFTFEITIRPKHELVTSGPYAWVRHPSYAGIYITLTGASLLFLTPNATWVNTSGSRTWLGMLLVAFWCVKCIFAFRGTCLRVSAEDQVLKETFGEEWEVYRERVPWRLVPWVF